MKCNRCGKIYECNHTVQPICKIIAMCTCTSCYYQVVNRIPSIEEITQCGDIRTKAEVVELFLERF